MVHKKRASHEHLIQPNTRNILWQDNENIVKDNPNETQQTRASYARRPCVFL